MKAAVMYSLDEAPEYRDFPDPLIQDDKEVLVYVKAAALKHFDKSRAAGKHYSSQAPKESGRIPGGDGVGMLADGTRVYGLGISGTLAEKAVMDRSTMVKLPDGLDDATAAALPNAVTGAAMGLKFKGDIQPGDVVLINGATGFTGHMAVQIARYYGAGKVIATGRNLQSLAELAALGADEIISVQQDNASFVAQLKSLHVDSPIDIVIDYLWGHTAEMILASLKGSGSYTHRVRYVSAGSITGDIISLSAAILRSVDLQLAGSGLGAWTRPQVAQLFNEILPEMFQLAATGQLQVKTVTLQLEDIARLWDTEVPGGHRLVVKV